MDSIAPADMERDIVKFNFALGRDHRDPIFIVSYGCQEKSWRAGYLFSVELSDALKESK